ncbi:unnamed protein product, partial [Chrysoparadoxa australica]
VPVLGDSRRRFQRPTGPAETGFPLKTGQVVPGKPLRLTKRQMLRGNATTYTLHPGRHGVIIQVNGQDVAEAVFELLPAQS